MNQRDALTTCLRVLIGLIVIGSFAVSTWQEIGVAAGLVAVLSMLIWRLQQKS